MDVNQCDGCKMGFAVKDNIHVDGNGMPYIGCTASLYKSGSPLSDLEIVQKALIKDSTELAFDDEGGWTVYLSDLVHAGGDDLKSLLTWAKQTIGEE